MAGARRRPGVVVLTTSFPLSAGSVSGLFVERLVEALADGARITVITPAGTAASDDAPPRGYSLVPVRYAPRRWRVLAHRPGGIPTALAERGWRYALLPGLLAALAAACARHGRGADLVHANWAANGALAGLAGLLTDTPVVTTLRGEDVNQARRSAVQRLGLRLCLALSDRVVAVSEHLAASVREISPGTAPRLRTIPNGVDERFLALGELRETGARQTALRVLTAGHLIRRKSVETLVQAVAMVSPRIVSRVTVAGDGPRRRALEELARRLGVADRFDFAGRVSPETLAELLLQADLFVLASRSEGRPNVLLEAMAAGLPVAATAIPGVDDLIEDGRSGLLFAAGDEAALARALERLAGDRDLAERLGRAGRRVILERGLLWSRTAALYLALYDEVLAERRGAG